MSEKNVNYVIKNTPVVLWITKIVSVLCFVLNLIGCIKTLNNMSSLIVNAVETIIGAYLLYYLFFAYKKPHDNTLKYVMLSFAGYLGVSLAVNNVNRVFIVITTLMIIGISYVSGRLADRARNRYIILGVLILSLVRSFLLLPLITNIVGGVNFLSIMMTFDCSIFWYAICLVYITKHAEHLQAGEDADSRFYGE